VVVAAGITMPPVTGTDAEAIARFSQIARHDPVDRLLVAQAWRHHLTLLRADRVLLALGKDFIVDAGR
jgi:PIN domain nuclease of toxin-antitoxin system